MITEQSKSRLQIENADSADSGVYMCEIEFEDVKLNPAYQYAFLKGKLQQFSGFPDLKKCKHTVISGDPITNSAWNFNQSRCRLLFILAYLFAYSITGLF